MIVGAIAADQPRWLLSRKSSNPSMSWRRESADVVPVVHVAGRRTDQDQAVEAVGLLRGSEHADHRAHRVPHEDDVGQVQGGADLQHVLGVAVQRPVLGRGRRRGGPSGPRPRGRRARRDSRASNAGATKRHMCWSQPKPWAKTMGWVPWPDTVTLLRSSTDMVVILGGGGFSTHDTPRAGASPARKPPSRVRRSGGAGIHLGHGEDVERRVRRCFHAGVPKSGRSLRCPGPLLANRENPTGRSAGIHPFPPAA